MRRRCRRAGHVSDILLLGVGWPLRALLRAQLLEEGFDVCATDTWMSAVGYLKPGSKPRMVIVDLQGLPNPAGVLSNLSVWPPRAVLKGAARP
jgi:hypothetical protein